MERFAADADGILVATDVAARGLDLPSVAHVLHLDLPHTADAYTHRSGRAAHQYRPVMMGPVRPAGNATPDEAEEPGSCRGYSLLLLDPRDRREMERASNMTLGFKRVKVDTYILVHTAPIFKCTTISANQGAHLSSSAHQG